MIEDKIGINTIDRQHHRNNHDRQTDSRHSVENIYYQEDVNSRYNERRHSISSEYGVTSRHNPAVNRYPSDNLYDKKQSWYESIRGRYQQSNRTSNKDIEFPKTLENYRTKYFEIKNKIIGSGSKLWEEADKRRLTERRKKTVRFDGGGDIQDDGWMSLSNVARWDSLRQGSQDSGTKDSGIETSSNFTSSEDSTRGDFKVQTS